MRFASRIDTTLLCLCACAALPALAQAPAARERWAPIGSGALLGDPSGATLAGRVSALAVDPGNPRHWLAGTPAGGVWRSFDAGDTWAPLTDAQPSLATGAVAIAAGRPTTYYVGTGDRAGSVGTYAGAGLLRSTDAGATWTQLAASTFAGGAFSALLVDPRDASVLVAATERGAAGLDPDLRPPRAPRRGLWKSTDGGASWAQKGPRDAAANDVTDLAADPTNFNRLFAGVGSHPPGPTNGLWRSTDAGETWAPVPGPWQRARALAGRVRLALAPSNPNVLYVAVAHAHSFGLLGLWRTSDAWSPAPVWTRVSTAAIDGARAPGLGLCGQRCWFTLALSVDPEQADTLYIGGLRLWRCASCGTATAWSAAPPVVHVDQHALAWAGARLVVGNDGGVWSTLAFGAAPAWRTHNDGLAVTQFWAGCLHPWRADWALSGSQDNGAQLWDGREWRWIGVAGDGGSCAVSLARPDSDWEEGLLRTRDGALTPWLDASWGIDWSEPKVFVTPIARCPARDDVFVAGLTSVWRSDDFFRAPLPTFAWNGGPWGEVLSALAFAPADLECRTYAAGGRAGGVLKLTTDGGSTWSDLDPAGVLPAGYISALAFDPDNAGVLYVAYARFAEEPGGGRLFRSANALGASPVWTDISPPGELPLNALLLAPTWDGTLWVGSDDGVWASRDEGLGWAYHGPEAGLPRSPVYDLDLSPQTHRLVAFTHGRGAFKLLRADVALRGEPRQGDEEGAQLFELELRNAGPDAAGRVTLEARPMQGLERLELVRGRGACAQREDRLECDLGALAAGERVRLELRARRVGEAPAALRVHALGDIDDPQPGNDSLYLAPDALALDDTDLAPF